MTYKHSIQSLRHIERCCAGVNDFQQERSDDAKAAADLLEAMSDQEVTPDFIEGYGEGMSAAVRMIRKAIPPMVAQGRVEDAKAIDAVCNVADRKIEEWRARPTNI